MRQIIVFDKQEIKLLMCGQILTLNLPSGETVQIQGEGKKMRLVNGSNGENPNGGNSIPHNGKGSTEKVFDFLNKYPRTWVSAKQVQQNLGGWQSSVLLRLVSQGRVEKKKGGRGRNGRPSNFYRVA